MWFRLCILKEEAQGNLDKQGEIVGFNLDLRFFMLICLLMLPLECLLCNKVKYLLGSQNHRARRDLKRSSSRFQAWGRPSLKDFCQTWTKSLN